jgi:hypothetical protein
MEHFLRQGTLRGNTTLLIRSDNTATVGDINRLSAATTLLAHLRRLHTLAKRMGIHLQAIHLPGVQNEEGDRLSRLGRSREYYVKREVFEEAAREMEFHPEEDAFASTPYLRSSIAVEHPRDALRISWKGRRLLLHPPPHLLARTIAKALKEETRAILIAPKWGAQPWTPMLARAAVKEKNLGPFEDVMEKTPRFITEGWRLPPGDAVAVLLDTRTTRGSASSRGF